MLDVLTKPPVFAVIIEDDQVVEVRCASMEELAAWVDQSLAASAGEAEVADEIFEERGKGGRS